VIVARPAGLLSADAIRSTAREYERALRSFGVDAQSVLPLFTTRPDWDVKARVLTDQYSPANLLNH
jgi:spermidine synthase